MNIDMKRNHCRADIICADAGSYGSVACVLARSYQPGMHFPGMPYPDNVRTAQEVENLIRAAGATPATIAIIAGQPCIGLDHDQLELLGKAGTSCRKVSRRDLLPTIAQGVHGATTVAATMLLAHLAGIHVFVTGGIGVIQHSPRPDLDIE